MGKVQNTYTKNIKITSRKYCYSSVSIESLIKMDSSLKHKIKIAGRVYDQVILHVGTLTSFLDYSYDHLKKTPTIYKPQCTSHQWDGMEARASVLFCNTCCVNLCPY